MKFILALFVFLSVLIGAASAASVLWTGYAHNNQWETANNWYPAQVPGQGDDVTIHTGNVQSTNFVTINSLLMGDHLEGKANLTVFNGFNVATKMQVYQNGNLLLTSGASAVSGTVTVQGGLSFASGSMSGAVSCSGTCDLSGAAAKTISNGALTLSGKSTVAGVVTFSGTSAALNVAGPSTWDGLSIMNGKNAAGKFDTSKGSVTMTGDVSVQAAGSFGSLNINNGVNLTIYNDVQFANTINIPNNTWVSTVGSAKVSTTLSGSGNFVAGGASNNFGAQNFAGMLACEGVACAFGGKKNSVGNLVVGAGAVSVTKGTDFSASLLSIQSGSFNVAGSATVDQLNFLGAGTVSGSTIKATKFYANTAQSFNLQGGVAVSQAANFQLTNINFGASGMFHLAKNSTSQVVGALTFSGPPNAAGFSNNGNLNVQNSMTSTNINMVGTGSWTVSGSTVSISGAEVAAATMKLAKGSSLSGSNSCLNVGSIAAGTVKAKIDTVSFACNGSCDNVVAACKPMPTDSFSFSS